MKTDSPTDSSALPARASRKAFLAAIAGLAVFAGTFVDAAWLRGGRGQALDLKRDEVVRLQLTDLCLFTEARYTRHPSQADLHSAFMDHPLALEHFPTGALIAPPAHLVDFHERLDRKAEIPD